MKEGWKRRGMRQYNRSEKPRFRWTEELHDRFLEAIRSLGGHERATPKQILLLMREKSMSISHVKSHLQREKDRIRKKLRPRGKIPKVSWCSRKGFLVEKFSNEWVPKMADFPILGSCGKSTGISQHKVFQVKQSICLFQKLRRESIHQPGDSTVRCSWPDRLRRIWPSSPPHSHRSRSCRLKRGQKNSFRNLNNINRKNLKQII
ncbi:unnamed protein product [Spirodela intermedia]|uniref:Uncharacterized protein n=1 Tax=Spirodela intermedia TaxID=51605 RepID=A0A7I8K8Z9_SPIIN|nr:unnamed protein product [Spirodela intermedia]